MAAYGPTYGVYTKEQIELFYPLFTHQIRRQNRDDDAEHRGFRYDDPVRTEFKKTHGKELILHFDQFAKRAVEFYPDYATQCPTLEQMIEDLGHKIPGIHINISKRRRCSIM